MSGDLSTLQLCELVSSSSGSKKMASLDEVLQVWHAVGTVVKTQLKAGKGVRLQQLGLFSLTSAGKPTFSPAAELLRSYKLKARALPSPDNIPVALLNYTQLSQVSGAPRETSERIYNAFVKAVGRAIMEGRNVLITIHRVAEITINAGMLDAEFMAPVSDKDKSGGSKKVSPRGAAATVSSRRVAAEKEKTRDPWDAKNARAAARAKAAAREAADMAEYLDYQQDQQAVAAAAAAQESPKFKAQNNIFTSGSDISVQTPPPKPRNPLLEGDGGNDPMEYHNPFEELGEYRTKKALNHADRIKHSGFVPPSRERVAAAKATQEAAYAVRKGYRPNSNNRPGSAAGSANGTLPSADTLSLLHSPRSRQSVDDGFPVAPPQGARRGRGGSAGYQSQSYLRKETLDRHTAMLAEKEQAAMPPAPPAVRAVRSRGSNVDDVGGTAAALGGVDARAVAAKALASQDMAAVIREKVVARGGSTGIRSLQRLLMIMDDNGDKRLSKDELKYGLRDYGVDLSPQELDSAFAYFDRDGNGFVDVTEFLVGIRGDLNESRKRMVKMAFDILDKDGSGFVTVDEIEDVYDVSANPEVQCGKKTPKEAMVEFIGQWESSANGNKDGIVTLEEFEDYYKEVSASIDDDTYFELMMRNAWRIAGGKGAAENTANLRVLVTDKDGRQKVATVEQELGLKQGDKEDIIKRLTKQGVDASNVELYGGMDTTEKPKKAAQRGGRGAPAPASQQQQPATRSSPRPSAPTSRAPAAASSAAAAFSGNNKSAAPGPAPVAASKGASSTKDDSEVFDIVQKTLYTPPCNFERLGALLQVSVVTFVPRLAQGHFMKRMSATQPQLTRKMLQDIWKLFDPNDCGSVELEKVHAFLSNRFGKDKSAGKYMGVIERVRTRILERCGQTSGIRGLQRTLMIMDDNGDKRLSKDELKYGLRDYGVELNIRELDEIFNTFDRDRNGFVDVTEFLVGIRGDLNESRKRMVKMAFDILDKDGSGFVTVDEIEDVYDVSANPEVQCGKKTPKEAMVEFIGQWERGEKDGIVTLEEFEDYYKEVSASIDGDDYFELMMRNAWRIAGGKGAAENTANLRVLVTDKDGRQKVATVEQELGLKQGDKEDIIKRLTKQGVDASNVELYGGMDTTEKPKKAGGAGPGQRPGIARAVEKAGVVPRQLESKAGVDIGNPRTTYSRNVAAVKLAAAFRGRVGRKVALQEKRKADAAAAAKAAQEAELNVPRARRLIRPQPKRK